MFQYSRTYRSGSCSNVLIIELLKQQEARKIFLTEKYQPFLDALDHMEVEIKSKLGIQEEAGRKMIEVNDQKHPIIKKREEGQIF